MGQKKKIGIESIPLEIKVEKEKDIREEIDYEAIHNEKMKEIEKLVKQRMAEAEKQAQTIIHDAYEDAKGIYENAKKDGFEKGRPEGYETGKDEANLLIKEALNIKNEVLKTKKNIVEGLEEQSIKLVIHTVEKILNKEVKDTYDTIIGLVKAGLSKCAYTESLVLRVSPDDYNYTESAKNKILCLAENIDDITIKQEPSLKKGSCIIDTVSGSIDCSIETQLNQIKSLFTEILESE